MMSTYEDCLQVEGFENNSLNNDLYSYEDDFTNGFDLESDIVKDTSEDINAIFPLRKAASCSTCGLCVKVNPGIVRNKEGGFALRKVASCSMCSWEVDDNDELNNSFSSNEDLQEIPRLKRSNSYSKALDDSLLEEENLENEDQNSIPDPVDNCVIRSPPDGGESLEELENSIVQVHNGRKDSPRNEKREQINKIFPSPKSNQKKKGKFKASSSQHSIEATEELDEIFGKLRKTPEQISFEEDDNFALTIDKFSSAESFSSTGKKPRKLLRRLLPPRSLFSKRNARLKHQRSRSEEVLFTNEPLVPDTHLIKSLSSMDIVNCGLEYSEDEETFLPENINERWIAYLNKIGGMSIFGGNHSIRYVWYQISCYQNELLQPLEDFMKSVIEQIQQAFIKCQELEAVLTLKTEQQEKETSRVYEDVEQVLQQERQQLQEKHIEHEEQTRLEYVKVLELKELETQELVKKNTELTARNEKLQNDVHSLKDNKVTIEQQASQLVINEVTLRKQNESLQEEKHFLQKKLEDCDVTIKELQEHVIQLTKMADIEKENYRQCLRRYQDLVEEKEFLDVNISNLSSEISDLRTHNKSLQELQSNISYKSIPYERQISDLDSSQFDENSNHNSQFNRSNTPESMFLSASFNEDPKFTTPLIQTPSGLTPLKRQNLPSVEQSRNILSSSPKKQYRNSAQTPIRLASSRQTDFKVIFTGDANVGKTSLIRRITLGKFRINREQTMEPDYSVKVIEYKQQEVKLKLWDTVGQERFNSIPPSYFRKSDVVILMYDISDNTTFLNARTWIKTIHENTNENIFLLLVGNKSDLHHKRSVPQEKAKKLAKDHDAMFVETSAKTGESVQTMCEMIASSLLERDDTLLIRNDFENSLVYSLNYSQRRTQTASICCQ